MFTECLLCYFAYFLGIFAKRKLPSHALSHLFFVLCTFVKSKAAHNMCLPFPGWPWNVHLYSWVTFQVTHPLTFFF